MTLLLPKNEIDFAQLLASKICHDLISPIAAVNNGLELLEEDKDMAEEALGLIKQSARSASLRLQMMRFAFGAGHSLPQEMSVKQLKDSVIECIEESKLTLNLEGTGDDSLLCREQVKILCNLFLIGGECLPRGGDLNVTFHTPEHFSFTADGGRLIVPETKKELLQMDHYVLPSEPRLVVTYLIRCLADGYGYTAVLDEQTTDQLKIDIKKS